MKKNNKIKKIIILILIILFLLIIFSTIFSIYYSMNNNIVEGIEIQGISVSGITKENAENKLNEIINNLEKKEIIINYNNYENKINLNELEINYNINDAINNACEIGRKNNIFINNFEILKTIIFKNNIKLEINYDEKLLDSKIDSINANLPGLVQEYNYYIEDNNLIIIKGKDGIIIDKEKLKEKINNEINNLNSDTINIELPIINKKADEINFKKIHDEIYKQAQDAYITQNPLTVHPNVNGVDFAISIEEAEELLREEKEEYIIPLKITVAEKTVRDLGEDAFPNTLGNFTTRYDASNKNRSNNIYLASEKINGTIIMPGETFSYNQVVGKRTIDAGYKEAGAYAGGKVVQDVGGGICQISSTIYNTALLANLEIVDRSNHQFLTSYVPVSRDATVSWGGLDFKFKNTRTYPIKIVASAKNGLAKVSFYGIKEETEYEVVIQSKTLSYIPYTVKYIEDSSLAKGKEVVSQSGYNGCKSEAYRVLKLNGKVVSKTLLSRDTYDPMQRIIRRGTKKTITKKNDTKKDESANKVKNTQSNVVDGEN